MRDAGEERTGRERTRIVTVDLRWLLTRTKESETAVYSYAFLTHGLFPMMSLPHEVLHEVEVLRSCISLAVCFVFFHLLFIHLFHLLFIHLFRVFS